MLEFEWPAEWPESQVEAIRKSLQAHIQGAMAKGSNASIRGTVVVDMLSMGHVPPSVTLTGSREASAAHTAIVLSVNYKGDAQARLKGLEINLDTTGQGEPSFYPFEFTISGLELSGDVLLELWLYAYPTWPMSSTTHVLDQRAPGSSSSGLATPRQQNSDVSLSRSSSVAGTEQCGSTSQRQALWRRRTPGFGVLFGVGKNGMRRPESSSQADQTLSGGPPTPCRAKEAVRPPHAPIQPFTFCDVLTGSARIHRRVVKIQFFGDILQNFRVESNFRDVAGADRKVQATLTMLLQPAIEKFKTNGITIDF